MVASSVNATACLRTAVTLISAILVATPATVGDEIPERIDFAYKAINFNMVNARAMFEADFQRAVAQRGLKISSEEIAGAAAAAAGGVMHTDNWEQQTAIRGCGPAKQLCFEIVCDQCTGGR